MSSSEFFKGDTTLEVTIKPEDCPSNSGTKGDYFKLRYSKGDKCIRRKDLVCHNKYHPQCSEECSSDCIFSSSDRYPGSSFSSVERISSDSGSYHKKSNHKKIKKTIPLATFVQITDIHIIDPGNPSRSSFLAAYLPLIPALADTFRPYEAFSAQVAECMVRKINAVKKGPHLNQKISNVINTGDNSDSMSKNELTNYINILDGGKVIPNPIGEYVGVQDNFPARSYATFYHPDQHPEEVSNDLYKVDYGYPNFQDILHSASKEFCATGLNIPWYSGNGNHDTTKLGNYSLGFYKILTLFDEIATGKIPDLGSKLVESMSPIQAQLFIKSLTLQSAQGTLEILNRTELRDVPPSDKRLQFTSADFINMHFSTKEKPGPVGHGFDQFNIEENTLYYTFKVSDKITGIMLDSCNPNGNLENPDLAPNGSIGRIQIDWFERELRERHSNYFNNQGQLIKTDNKDELIMVFCHHTIDSMNNNATSPTTFDNDPQRILGPELVKILHRYPNVIALVNGHEHRNRVTAYKDPEKKTQGFWEINTASHIDYPQQSRIIEVGENNDDTLSIFCTMINHSSPADAERGCFSTGPAQNCRFCSSYQTSECDTSTHNSKYDSSKCSNLSKYDSSTDNSKYDSSKCSNSSKYHNSTDSSNSFTHCETSECKEEYSIEEIASISRELSYNDVFIVNKFGNGENRTGTKLDRNVELLLFNPLKRCK